MSRKGVESVFLRLLLLMLNVVGLQATAEELHVLLKSAHRE